LTTFPSRFRKAKIVGFPRPNAPARRHHAHAHLFLPPTAGTASVAGFDVLEQPLEVKRRVGYLPEAPPLYPEMDTVEYLTSSAG